MGPHRCPWGWVHFKPNCFLTPSTRGCFSSLAGCLGNMLCLPLQYTLRCLVPSLKVAPCLISHRTNSLCFTSCSTFLVLRWFYSKQECLYFASNFVCKIPHRRSRYGLDGMAMKKTTQRSLPGPFCLRDQRRVSGGHTLGVLHVLFNLVEVHVLVDRRAVLVHDAHGLVESGHCGR